MENLFWLVLGGTVLGWLLLGIFILAKYGVTKFCADMRGIFEGDDKEDDRLSFGRVFTFLFLLPAFLVIGYTVYKYTNGAGWAIFIGSGIAVLAALAPYALTKTTEVLALIEAVKGDKRGHGKGA